MQRCWHRAGSGGAGTPGGCRDPQLREMLDLGEQKGHRGPRREGGPQGVHHVGGSGKPLRGQQLERVGGTPVAPCWQGGAAAALPPLARTPAGCGPMDLTCRCLCSRCSVAAPDPQIPGPLEPPIPAGRGGQRQRRGPRGAPSASLHSPPPSPRQAGVGDPLPCPTLRDPASIPPLGGRQPPDLAGAHGDRGAWGHRGAWRLCEPM